MKQDSIIKYDIDLIIEEELNVESITDDVNGLNILLHSEKLENRIQIVFDSPISYRNTNESYLVKLWSETDDDVLGNVFYKIENSSYKGFFHEMSLGIYKDWNVVHYAIYTGQDCIDVLSVAEPMIRWYDEAV